LNSPYLVTVTVTNGSNSRLRTIVWDVTGDVAPLPGDFNNDGSVDAADYVKLRKNAAVQAQYDLWRANFGNSLNSASGPSVAAAQFQISVPAAATAESPNPATTEVTPAFITMSAPGPATHAVAADALKVLENSRGRDQDASSFAQTNLVPAKANVHFHRDAGFAALNLSIHRRESLSQSRAGTDSSGIGDFGGDDLLLLAADRVRNSSGNHIADDFDRQSDVWRESHGNARRYLLNDSVAAEMARQVSVRA
jgi:hypothetical protein